MEIAKMVMEYLRVLLAWPPLVAVVLLWFLVSQRDAIAGLIGRIKQVTFPGGGFETAQYSQLPAPATETKNTTLKDMSPNQNNVSARINVLERNFDDFLFLSFQSNVTIIMNLLDALRRKLMLDVFGGVSQPNTLLEKVQAIRGRIDPRAFEDLVEIAELMSKTPLPRERLIEAYSTSQLLIDYLRGPVTQAR